MAQVAEHRFDRADAPAVAPATLWRVDGSVHVRDRIVAFDNYFGFHPVRTALAEQVGLARRCSIRIAQALRSKFTRATVVRTGLVVLAMQPLPLSTNVGAAITHQCLARRTEAGAVLAELEGARHACASAFRRSARECLARPVRSDRVRDRPDSPVRRRSCPARSARTAQAVALLGLVVRHGQSRLSRTVEFTVRSRPWTKFFYTLNGNPVDPGTQISPYQSCITALLRHE